MTLYYVVVFWENGEQKKGNDKHSYFTTKEKALYCFTSYCRMINKNLSDVEINQFYEKNIYETSLYRVQLYTQNIE